MKFLSLNTPKATKYALQWVDGVAGYRICLTFRNDHLFTEGPQFEPGSTHVHIMLSSFFEECIGPSRWRLHLY